MTCRCGQPGLVRIRHDAHPIVSNDVPFGQDLCRSCYAKHIQFKADQLSEWLDYFKPRLNIDPHPHTTELKERLSKKPTNLQKNS